jgi:hypothetical protein
MEGHMFTNPMLAREFVLAGNATVTLRSQKTQNRYTFKVQKADDKDFWFVKHMIGSDNESDFTYLGCINTAGVFALTKRTMSMSASPQYRAFKYMWDRLPQGIAKDLEVWHEGRCGRCNRKLTVPESIESGFGPECIQHVGVVIPFARRR